MKSLTSPQSWTRSHYALMKDSILEIQSERWNERRL